MARHLNVPTVILGFVAAALLVALGGLLWMMQTGVGETHTAAIAVTASTGEAVSPPSDTPSPTADAPSPTASDTGSGASSGTGNEPVPVTIEGALLPDGVPTDVDAASFMGGTHAMSITIDGVVQRSDCAIVLMHVTPAEDITAFSLPNVGVVHSGLLYGGGTCDASGLEEAGYVSNFLKDRPAGETFAFFGAVPNPEGTPSKIDAVAVAVADGEYVFFEPTETTLP